MNWVRADFNTFDECKAMGDKYMNSYGYYCDSYQDNCGTTYYMLTLFDTNGNLFDYHSIQIPSLVFFYDLILMEEEYEKKFKKFISCIVGTSFNTSNAGSCY